MKRMIKEFKKAGLIYDSMDNIYNQIYYRPENDTSQKFVAVSGDFIICAWYSEVLDPELRLYDRRSFKPVATQQLYPSDLFFMGANKWMSHIYGEEEV